jgi:hypothetical protein
MIKRALDGTLLFSDNAPQSILQWGGGKICGIDEGDLGHKAALLVDGAAFGQADADDGHASALVQA